MATYTANYGLHQWVPGDNFLRTDFNTDFQKIDAGIKAALAASTDKVGAVTGTYIGNGTASRDIILGFQPKAILVEERTGVRGTVEQYRAGLALPDAPGVSRLGGTGVIVTENGFQVGYYSATGSLTNYSGSTYHYLAIR